MGLILEDNDERVRDFESAVALLGTDFRLRLWRDAPTMITECPPIGEWLDSTLVVTESKRFNWTKRKDSLLSRGCQIKAWHDKYET
jgi:hypothetical protein